VRDAAILAIVEVYRHVGEKVRVDLTKRGIPPGRRVICFDFFKPEPFCVTVLYQNFKLTKNFVFKIINIFSLSSS